MKPLLRRTLLFAAALYLLLGLSPLVFRLAAERTPQQEAAPAASPAPEEAADAVFRIYDEARAQVLTVPDADFLRGALPCEMTLDAPDEALKAQAVAIYTFYSARRLENSGDDADFTCNSAEKQIYMTDDDLAALYGDGWPDAKARLDAICAEVAGQQLLYEGEPIESTFFAISAGCTQPYENVWPENSYPYLQAVACPSDMLYDGYRSSAAVTPDAVREAFPDVEFTDDPAVWFTDARYFDSGYVESIALCGTTLSGVAVREALGLRSASFSVSFDGEQFTFTTLGWGHGVGMSQAGAIYMAENGAGYAEILAYFYPGAALSAP